MYDDIDRYLGRCLKNWVARHLLPVDGRSRLLQAARSPFAPQEQDHILARYLALWRNRYGTPPYAALYPHRDWRFIGPFTQSSLWSFHLASDWRLAQ